MIDENDMESQPQEGSEGEQWTQVCKKKKRDAMASELPQSNKPTKSSYEKLLDKLQETFVGLSKAEAADLVKDIRRQRGNLSGVTVKQILDAAFNLIKKRMQDGQMKLPLFNEDHMEPCGEKMCVFFLRFLKYKTEMCTPQNSGGCRLGDKCWFAHTRAELRPLPKREMCPFELKGSCKHAEKCVFAHNVGELNLPEYESSFFKSTVKISTNLPPRLQKILRSKSHDTDPDEGEICVICCDNLSDYITKALDCGHIFHEECIKKWVYGQERTCPTCRQLTLFPEEFPRLGKE